MMMIGYASFLRRVLDNHRRGIWISVFLALLACAALPYPRIYIELDPLLSEDSEITQTIRLAKRLFGPTDYVVIGLTHENGQALDAAGARQLQRLQDAVLTLPGIDSGDLTSLLAPRAKVVENKRGDIRIAPI